MTHNEYQRETMLNRQRQLATRAKVFLSVLPLHSLLHSRKTFKQGDMLRFAILLFLVVTVTEADINYKNKVKRDLNSGTIRKRQGESNMSFITPSCL